MRREPITAAQAMAHPTVVETINTLSQLADRYREELEAARKDVERLNWLQEQGCKTPHLGWVARNSKTGRGYRLHQDKEGFLHVRFAIDNAMEAK